MKKLLNTRKRLLKNIIKEKIYDMLFPWRIFCHRLYDLKWWFLHRTFYRYHVVKTGLEPGWYEFDARILHTSFQMLVDFVEKSWEVKTKQEFNARVKGYSTGWTLPIEKKMIADQKSNDTKIWNLYYWWTVTRKNRIDPYDLMDDEKMEFEPSEWDDENEVKMWTMKPSSKEHRESIKLVWNAERKYYNEDTKKLKELIDLREKIWN